MRAVPPGLGSGLLVWMMLRVIVNMLRGWGHEFTATGSTLSLSLSNYQDGLYLAAIEE